ncbi:hypothetical protein, partial [Pseudomonas sp. CM25]|uniref:hypothetical protein n=1 Tax=Pseudomonas sp. CM25 TaxID=2738448 RepID=UPI001C499F56
YLSISDKWAMRVRPTRTAQTKKNLACRSFSFIQTRQTYAADKASRRACRLGQQHRHAQGKESGIEVREPVIEHYACGISRAFAATGHVVWRAD